MVHLISTPDLQVLLGCNHLMHKMKAVMHSGNCEPDAQNEGSDALWCSLFVNLLLKDQASCTEGSWK